MNDILALDEIHIDNDDDNEEINSTEDKRETKYSEKMISKSEKQRDIDSQMFLFEKNPYLEDSMEDNLTNPTFSRLNESVEDIYKNNNKFNHVNPMRKSIYAKNKQPEIKRHSREEAIKELITNLKTQYIIFNIRNFVRNYHIHSNPNISQRNYKLSRIIRNMSLYIYMDLLCYLKGLGFVIKEQPFPFQKVLLL